MPTVHLSPIGNDTPFYSEGVQLSGGLLYTYLAGTTTLATTYTDSAGTVANANPIVLNSEGYPAVGGSRVQVWLTATVSYKFILKDSDGVTLWSMDNIDGINDINLVSSEWVSTVSGITAHRVSGTVFTLQGDGIVSGDQTAEALPGRWVKLDVGGSISYGIIVSSSYASPLTTVTVVIASGTFSADPVVYYGLLRPDHPSTPLDATNLKATAVVTPALTTNIWTTATGAGPVNGNIIHISPGSTITSFGTAQRAGQKRYLIFDGATLLTHNAGTLVLPGGVSITTAANDYAEVTADTTTKMLVAPYVRASGQPVVPTVPRGSIDGLIVSRSAANTLTISPGQASDSTANALMNLPSSMVKSQSAWAPGGTLGGLLAGSVPVSAYPGGFVRVFLLYNPATQTGDVGFQDSASGVTPDMTLPNASGFTLYRWIFDWPIVVAGNGFELGFQSGEEFWYNTIAVDIGPTNIGLTPTEFALRVPPTIKFKAIFQAHTNGGVTTSVGTRVYDPDLADVALSTSGTPISTYHYIASGHVGQQRMADAWSCWTNSTQEVKAVCDIAGGGVSFATLGYVHQRGRNR